MGSNGRRLTPSSPIVTLGRVGAPFGVKGWVHAHSFTEPQRLLPYKTWQLLVGKDWVAFEILAVRLQGKGCVAQLAGIETREQAQALTQAEIGVFREELPELAENEYYWVDLIGLDVITDQGQVLGKVKRLFETGSNDVLVVKGEHKEHWIPYLPGEYVLEINLELKQMRVHWDPEF